MRFVDNSKWNRIECHVQLVVAQIIFNLRYGYIRISYKWQDWYRLILKRTIIVLNQIASEIWNVTHHVSGFVIFKASFSEHIFLFPFVAIFDSLIDDF